MSFESDIEDLIRNAPCRQPGFVFKPYITYSKVGGQVHAHWENVETVMQQVTPEIQLHVERVTGRVVGVSLALPRGTT